MMRVLHVTHQYKPAIGGSERYFSDISEELARRGHVVDVATTTSRQIQTWQSALPSRDVLNRVNVRRFNALQRGRIGWNALRIGNAGLRATRNPIFELPIVFGNGPLAPGLGWHILRHASAY